MHKKSSSPRQKIFRRASAVAAGLMLAGGIGVASVPGASAAATSVTQKTAAQKPDDIGFLLLLNYKSGLCLDISSNGAIQNNCTSEDNTQAWTFPNASVAHYYMIEDENKNCLGIEANSTAQGARAVITSCASTANRQWHVLTIGEINGTGLYEFVNKNSGLCLTVDNGSMAAGAIVNQSTCTGNSAMIWTRAGGI